MLLNNADKFEGSNLREHSKIYDTFLFITYCAACFFWLILCPDSSLQQCRPDVTPPKVHIPWASRRWQLVTKHGCEGTIMLQQQQASASPQIAVSTADSEQPERPC